MNLTVPQQTQSKKISPGSRPPFERIALVLQGGGALGAYQGGVYQALTEAELHPDWVAGISIGAINSAIIAGNPPECRVERLRTPDAAAEFLAFDIESYLFVPEPLWKEHLDGLKGVRIAAKHYDFYRNCDVLVVTNR